MIEDQTMLESNTLPKAISPLFETEEANKNVQLFEGEIEVLQDSLAISGKGTIEFRWYPSPATIFSISSDSPELHNLFSDEEKREVQILASHINLRANAVLQKKIAPDRVQGRFTTDVEIGQVSKVDSLCFHLANFLNFDGDPIKDTGCQFRGSQLKLEMGEWSVCLHEVKKLSTIYASLKELRGYAITHVGELTRTDKQAFEIGKAKDILTTLFYLFSFMNSSWTPPILAFVREKKDVIWQSWNLSMDRLISRWSVSPKWCPRNLSSVHEANNVKNLNALSESFFTICGDEPKREVLHSAINWYIQSKEEANLETAIILIQVTLELLSWAILVELGEKFSKTKFKRKDAKVKMKTLLCYVGIPTKIPVELKALCTERGSGVEIIAKIRNSLVHPRLSNRNSLKIRSHEEMFEARKLGTWYLELVLLSFLNYQGVYHNRITSTEFLQNEPVPWSVEQ